MSARLIGELANWLMSPAAVDVSPNERLVLFVVAERSHERSRIMLRHRGDDEQLVDRIARTTGLARDGALKRTFRALAKRGLDVRIPVANGKDGRPVFACEGHSMRFRLPEFPASVAIPEAPADPVDNEADPVDEPVDNLAQDAPDDDQRGTESSRLSARGVRNRPASGAQRGAESSRPTPSNYLSDPSTSSSPSCHASSVAEDVGTLSAREPDGTNQDQRLAKTYVFDLRSALSLILQLSPEAQSAVTEQAAKELGPDAGIEALRIRAAEIAMKGIPA
ncbi:hypothetical protein GCM10010182_67360 [Actinomadura cremea]|nr:hypothetical protein GCM10010182_67360 [Actinomadura cremea]